MKQIFSLILSIVPVFAFSQGIIATNAGDFIKAYNIEVSNNSIFYTLAPDENAQVQKISKSDIFAIRKENGEKIVIGMEQTTTSTATNLNDSHKIELGDETLPNIDFDNYHGFLLSKGNAVYVEEGSENYEKAGGERLKELLKKDGFWKIAARKEQAHFYILYNISLKGLDHINESLFSMKNYITDKEKEVANKSIARHYFGMHSINASEDDNENIRAAEELYKKIITKMQSDIEKEKNPQKSIYKYFFIP